MVAELVSTVHTIRQGAVLNFVQCAQPINVFGLKWIYDRAAFDCVEDREHARPELPLTVFRDVGRCPGLLRTIGSIDVMLENNSRRPPRQPKLISWGVVSISR